MKPEPEKEIDHILYQGNPLAYIIRSSFHPQKSTFLTPPEFKQQVGFIVYPAGSEIPRHVHHEIDRKITGTSEVVLIKSGRCIIDVYNDDQELVESRELSVGDLVLMVGGGHGFRIIEHTVLLEIKQGPYFGVEEKKLF